MQTIQEAKEHLRANWEDGLKCPCCTQWVRLWKHSLNSAIVITLINMKKTNREWVNINSELPKLTTMYAIAQHWDLIEPDNQKVEGKKTSGVWRLTLLGHSFLEGKTTIPKNHHIFNNVSYRTSGGQVHVRELLGKNFDYGELAAKTTRQEKLL